MAFETRYRDAVRIVEQNLGYDPIATCRPKFVFFSFTGLRPSTPHWIFFDGVEVTKWVNTSYNLADFNDEARGSSLRNPGDRYLNATSFPLSLGGPTAASGPVTTDATGTLEGAFYIQSNASLSFNTGRRLLTAIDVSVLNKNNSQSYAEAEYSAIGQYEIYTEYQQTYQESYDVWVDPPVVTPPSNDNGWSIIQPTLPNSVTSNESSVVWRDDGDRGGDAYFAPAGPSEDKPGNVISRALGIEYDADGDGDTSDGDDGCVIATYAQTTNSTLLSQREKKKAEIWCIRTYHGKWWGEAIRRGYRYLGRKAISSGNAERHFQEFIDYVAFGRGDKRTLKTFANFAYRTLQFFVYGLTVARKEK
jgi:hypothetical protein